VSDIDTAVVDSLKALDPEWPIREADITAPACAKCGSAMKDVVTIAPVAGEPGLVAYECPACGHVTSVIVPPPSTG